MFSRTMLCLMVMGATLVGSTSAAHGGPLLDWLRSRCNRNSTNVDVGGYQATSGTFTQAPTTLLPGQCQKTCMQTCQRTVVNYVPYTAYRTEWKRVPVTQYRPVTNTDPCSGCTVTCMRPCTSYSWQLQRKPYTTYRPVYKSYNYRVPVTTITNDCATGNCNSCSTCGVPAVNQGAIPNAGGFVPSTNTPADTVPTLSNRPVYGVYDSYPVPSGYQSYSVPSTGQFPNNYAAPQAYSGMTQTSGYGTASQVYTPPVPSSYAAPQPGYSDSPNVVQPADQTPILEDTTSSTRPGQSSVQSVLSNTPEAQPLMDPEPDMRWDFNVPQLDRAENQSAMQAVQVRWAYTPTNGATWSDSAPLAAERVAAPSRRDDVNQQWQSRGTQGGVNSDWQ